MSQLIGRIWNTHDYIYIYSMNKSVFIVFLISSKACIHSLSLRLFLSISLSPLSIARYCPYTSDSLFYLSFSVYLGQYLSPSLSFPSPHASPCKISAWSLSQEWMISKLSLRPSWEQRPPRVLQMEFWKNQACYSVGIVKCICLSHRQSHEENRKITACVIVLNFIKIGEVYRPGHNEWWSLELTALGLSALDSIFIS